MTTPRWVPSAVYKNHLRRRRLPRYKLRLDSLEERTVPTVIQEIEVNDTPLAAQPVVLAQGDVVSLPSDDWLTIVGSIGSNTDLDFYRFTLNGDRGVFFDIDSLETGVSTGLDAVLNLYDSTALNILTADDGYDFEGFDPPTGSVSTFMSLDSSMYADLPAGTYYVSVNSYVNGSTGNYHLRILADPNYTAAPPALHSDASANDTLFLDFNGHAASPDAWGTYAAAAYDFNGTPGIFTPAERLAIRHVWEIVTEDFSPFNVDVTTVQTATGNGLGHRHVITNSSPTILGLNATTQTAAILNSYASGTSDNVSFTFAGNFSTFGTVNSTRPGLSGPINATPLELGNSSSEAFGRALGLGSYRTASNGGSVGSLISNAIMATPDEGLNRELWATGTNTNGLPQDDMTVISNSTNTFGYRSDDYGNTISTATPLAATADTYAAIGVIEQVNDVDMFRIAVSGATVIALNVFDYATNLDTELRLRDESGNQIASSFFTSGSAYDAAISMTLNAGVYYVDVQGTGSAGVAGQYALLIQAANTYSPPVLANIESSSLAYTENEIRQITQTLTVADSDSANMSGATVSITSNFASGEDSLVFTNQGGITGSYNAGVLTLTGNASKAAYQTALRSVRYENSSDSPSTATRTVTFRVVDSTGISSITQSRDITIATLNDAPVLDNAGDMALSSILEDSGAGTGTLITAIIASAGGNRITDPDGAVPEGIAVIAADTTNGSWEFTTNGGTNWSSLGNVSTSSARLLAADANTRVRFVPNADYFGTIGTALTFRAWDQTAGSNGGLDNPSPNGGETAYSTATEVASLIVTAVNDVPSFTKGGNQSVAEDAGLQTVAGWATNLSKGPANESGQTLSFIVSNDNNALFSVQPAISSTGTLTYTPAANANGAATVTVKIKDDGGTANGGVDTSAAQTFTITVTPVNDAPLLDNSGAMALGTILEDDVGNTGTLITALIASAGGDRITDVDTGAVEGIAIVNANAVNGTWQFSTNGGTNWNALGSVSDSNAMLLAADANTRVRFVPNANFHGTIATALTFRAWDTTSGANGNTASAVTNGGTTAFSTATETASLTVTPVNDSPSFTKGADQTVNEDAGQQTVGSWATNVSPGPNESGQTVSFLISTNNDALFSTLPAIDSAGTLTYTPASDANGVATVTVRAKDDGGTTNGGVDTSAAQTFTITINAVNDAPVVLAQTPTLSAVLEDVTNPPGQQVDTFLAATDVDAGALKGIAVTGFGGIAGTWSYSTNGGTNWTDFGATSSSSARLLRGSDLVRFIPAANANGTATITYHAWDQTTGTFGSTVDLTVGGSTGGITAYSSLTQTANAPVTAVNDRPSFTKGSDPTTLEDAGLQSFPGWATNLSAGPPDESGQTLSFEVTNNTNPGLFASGPAVSPTGTLTYTTATNANGSATITLRILDNGGTANGGEDASATQTFTINVTAVNDPPSFTKGPNIRLMDEFAGAQSISNWATNISPGPIDESAQTVTFEVTGNTNPTLFTVAPAIDPNGTLTYTPASGVHGYAVITLRAVDNGATANGGDDTSDEQTFRIGVNPINQEPSFTAGSNQIVDEDAGLQTVAGWATNINPGSPFEDDQVLTFEIVSNSNPTLFSVAPAVAANGTLSFQSAANANGSATIQIRLKDDGGILFGGDDTSPTQTFDITVNAVNDPPSFVIGGNQTVNEDAGAQTVTGWATSISPGPSDEAGQTVSFLLDATNSTMFAAGPAISPDGTLTYTPAANANGTSTVTVRLQDNGGGADTSAEQTFTITVNAVNDPPSFVKGADQTANEDSGTQTVTGWASSISPGPANENGQTLTFLISTDNDLLFSTLPAVSSSGTLTYTPAFNAFGTATVTVRLQDNAGGDDTSGSQTFTIEVLSVNDAPTFTKGSDQVVAEGTGQTVVNGWATNISAGAANESGQTLTFLVSTNNNALLPELPVISSNGTLTFRPADNVHGSATVTVRLTDNGGTDRGGEDTSAEQTFVVTVNNAPVLDASGSPILTPIPRNTFNSPGDIISDIIGDSITDSNAGALEGIAVIGTSGNGQWQFSQDNGQTWTNLNAASFSAARLLRDSDRLRFVPITGFVGNATITYHAWDRSAGVAGGTANLNSGTGGSTAFSVANDTATLMVATTLVPISEDNKAPRGDTVASLASAFITDADLKAKKGIAVVGITGSDNGAWQYFNGVSWRPLTNVSDSRALLLRDTYRVRFVPKADFFGTASIEYHAWDQTIGVAGSVFDLTSLGTGGGSAFSAASGLAIAFVDPVNDAPLLDIGGEPALTRVTPTANDPAGDLIGDVLASSATDVDGDVVGMAAIAFSGKGTWQYQRNGSIPWENAVGFSARNPLFLNRDDRIRFVPTSGISGVAKVMFKAWDRSRVSTATEIGTVLITTDPAGAPNTAPLLDNSGSPTLTTTLEDTRSPAGDTVANLIGTTVSDSPGALRGIAITGLTGSTSGSWQFSTTGGRSWKPIGNVSESIALLLRENDKLRFVPNKDFNGLASVTYHAWDQTRGAAGGRADLTLPAATGASTPFSTAVETATIAITAANDAPVLDVTPNPRLISALKDETDPPGTSVAALLGTAATDVDGDPVGMAVIAAAGKGTWQYRLSGGPWLAFGEVNITTARLLGAADDVRFVPEAGFVGVAKLTYKAWDGTAGTVVGGTADARTSTAFSRAAVSATVAVNSVDDRPVLDTKPTPYLTPIQVGDGDPSGDQVATLLGSAASDLDRNASIGIAVISAPTTTTTGKWQFSSDGVNWSDFVGVSARAPKLLFATDYIRFAPVGTFTGSARITYKAWDSASINSNGPLALSAATETATAVVNSAPILNNG